VTRLLRSLRTAEAAATTRAGTISREQEWLLRTGGKTNEIRNRLSLGCAHINPGRSVPGFSFTLEQGRWEELSLKRIALALVLSSALLGLGSVPMAQDSMPTAPNNSAVNVRDRTPDAMTADQQSNTKSDMTTTREIRKAVVKDHSLSILAHNVKIVSVNGKVTLRGPVNTEKEKVAIASKARAIAGRGNVDNQIEVKTQ
jgi:hyperosmotically inducible protein